MARIAGVDLPRDKRGEVALTYIYGIGRSTALKIIQDVVSMPIPGSGSYRGRSKQTAEYIG